MKPNTLIFVGSPSDDVVACAAFYRDVFGCEVEGRPTGVFHRGVPGGYFPLDDGSVRRFVGHHRGPVDQGRPRTRHPSRSHERMRHTSE